MLRTMSPTLSAIHIFPLKSCAPLPLASAHVGTRGFAGDPLRFAIRERGASIERRRELDAHPWPAALDATEESAIELARRLAHQA